MSESGYSGAGVLGVGKYVPRKRVTNLQLEKWTGVAAQSIVEKTGIVNRYIVEDDETASGMSAIAARQAIEMAGIEAVGC